MSFYQSLLLVLISLNIWASEEVELLRAVYDTNDAMINLDYINKGQSNSCTDKSLISSERDKQQLIAYCLKRANAVLKALYPEYYSILFYGENAGSNLFPPTNLLHRDEKVVEKSKTVDSFTALKENDFTSLYLHLQNGEDVFKKDKNDKALIDYFMERDSEPEIQNLLKMIAGEFVPDPTLKNYEAGNIYLREMSDCHGFRHRNLNYVNRLMHIPLINSNGSLKDFVLEILKKEENEDLKKTYRNIVQRYLDSHKDSNEYIKKYHDSVLTKLKYRINILQHDIDTKFTEERLSRAAERVAKLIGLKPLSIAQQSELDANLKIISTYKKTRAELEEALGEFKEKHSLYIDFISRHSIMELELEKGLEGKGVNQITPSELEKKISSSYNSFILPHGISLKFSVVSQAWSSNHDLNAKKNEINNSFASQLDGYQLSIRNRNDLLDTYLRTEYITNSQTLKWDRDEIERLQDELNDSDYLGRVKQAMLIVNEVDSNNIPLSYNRFLQDEYEAASTLLKKHSDNEFQLEIKRNIFRKNVSDFRKQLLIEIRNRIDKVVVRLGGRELTDEELLDIINGFLDNSSYLFYPDTKENREKLVEELKLNFKKVNGVGKKISLLEFSLADLHNADEENQFEVIRLRKNALLKPIEIPNVSTDLTKIDEQMLSSLRKSSCYDYKRNIEPEINCDNLNTDNKLFGDFGRWFQREILDNLDNLWDRVGDEVKRSYNRVTAVIKHPRANFGDFYLRYIKSPVEIYRKENRKLFGKTLEQGVKRFYKILDEVLLQGGSDLVSPINRAITRLCENAGCPDMGIQCDSAGNCVALDRNGNPSDIIVPVQMDWESAIEWIKKTELDDLLRNLQNNSNPNLDKIFENSKERQNFAALALQSLESLRAKLDQAATPQDRELLLAQIQGQKDLMDFIKGVGVGSYNNIKDAINAILELPSALSHADEILAVAVRFYETNSMLSMFVKAESALITKWDEFYAADLERRGEMIGYLAPDILMAMLPAGAAARFGSATVREAVSGSRLAGGLAEFTEALVRIAPSKDGVQNFLYLMRNEIGAVGDLTEIARRIDGIKYPDIWTQGRFQDSIISALDHYQRHGRQFGASGAIEYVDMTYDFVRNPPVGAIKKLRSNGDILIYHPGTNTFATVNSDGIARTMFKPDEGIDYWNRQVGSLIE